MVGESYESTSWRSGPLSIVSSQKVEHVNTGEVGSSDFTDLKVTEFFKSKKDELARGETRISIYTFST